MDNTIVTEGMIAEQLPQGLSGTEAKVIRIGYTLLLIFEIFTFPIALMLTAFMMPFTPNEVSPLVEIIGTLIVFGIPAILVLSTIIAIIISFSKNQTSVKRFLLWFPVIAFLAFILLVFIIKPRVLI